MSKKERNNGIKEVIQQAMLSGKKHILLNDSSFFIDLIDDKNNNHNTRSISRILTFCMVVIGTAMCAVSLLAGGVFLIKNILLYNQPPIVTESGSIVPQRSCSREQVLFFFNTSECWSSTGVYLQKGDKIRISQSGGFHNDLKGVCQSAKQNKQLKYPYYDSRMVNGKVEKDPNSNLLYNHDDAAFGSLLWQVNDRNIVRQNPTKGNIHQLSPQKDSKEYITIEENGEIFFSVNDIYFTNEVINNYLSKPQASQIEFIANMQERLDFVQENDLLYYIATDNKQINVVTHPDSIRHHFGVDNMRDIWFKDNMGSIMVCIEIMRVAENMPWYAHWYRQTENHIFEDINQHSEHIPRILSVIYNCAGAITLLLLQMILLVIWIFSKGTYFDIVSELWSLHPAISAITIVLIIALLLYYYRNQCTQLVTKAQKAIKQLRK